MLKIEKYDEITVTKMKEILTGLGVEVEDGDKKSVYEIYEKTLKEQLEKGESKDVEEKEDIEKVVEEPQKKEVVTQPRKKGVREIEHNELIPVRSVTQNGLTYVSPKTHLKITWGEYGDIELLEFGELLTMRASSKEFLNKPYVVVDDEEVAQKLGLTKIYEELLTDNEVDDFLSMPLEDMEQQLPNLPQSSKELIAEKARNTVGKTFNDIRKIKLLDKELNIGLSFLID